LVVSHCPVAGLQAADWQRSSVTGHVTGVPTQFPSAWHMSSVVQALPSSQAIPTGESDQAVRLVAVAHIRHGMVGWVAPSAKQAPSIRHDPALMEELQPPVAGSQALVVQASSSSQFTGAPAQRPAPSQTSLVVQASPSSQGVPAFAGRVVQAPPRHAVTRHGSVEAGQATPQAPQLARSRPVSTQRPAQRLCPLGQGHSPVAASGGRPDVLQTHPVPRRMT
jgi:hypothetical protein